MIKEDEKYSLKLLDAAVQFIRIAKKETGDGEFAKNILSTVDEDFKNHVLEYLMFGDLKSLHTMVLRKNTATKYRDKIKAIKKLRMICDLTLLEAKEKVEELDNHEYTIIHVECTLHAMTEHIKDFELCGYTFSNEK